MDLIGSPPVGVTADGFIIGDTIHYSLDENGRLPVSLCRIFEGFIRQRLQIDNNSKTDKCVKHGILLTSGWNHYGHWILEHALKLRFLEYYSNRSLGRLSVASDLDSLA